MRRLKVVLVAPFVENEQLFRGSLEYLPDLTFGKHPALPARAPYVPILGSKKSLPYAIRILLFKLFMAQIKYIDQIEN